MTRKNVCHALAPRSWAASSSDRSNPMSLDLTVTTTNEMLNITWATTIVMKPVFTPSDRNSDSTAVSATSGAANNNTGRIQARSERPEPNQITISDSP